MKKTSLFVAAALTIVGSVAPTLIPSASAQELNLGPIIDPMIAGNAAAQRQIAEEAYKRETGHSPNARPKSSQAKKKPVLHGSTRFKSSFAVRKRNLAQFVAKMRSADPQSAASLERAFAKSDPIAAIAPALRRYDLRTDDVADAAAAYLATAWYAVRGRNDDPSKSQVKGLREQMRRAMLSLPEFASASDATKQQLAEAMLVQTMIADASITAAKAKPALMAKTKAAINQGARNMFHLDLSKLKLTNQGLSA